MNKKQIIIISISCLLFIIPFIVVGFFNHPQSDDYRFAAFVQQYGFGQAQLEWYLQWSGRWFSNFVSSLQPILLHNWSFYKILPCLEILWLFLMCRIILAKSLPESKSYYFPLLFAAGITCIWLVYNPTLAETLYWVTGYNNYILIFPFVLILISKFKNVDLKTSWKDLCWILVLNFILTGSSEIYLFFILYWIFLWCTLKIIYQCLNFKVFLIIGFTMIYIF